MCPKVTEAYREAARTQILDAAQKVFARKGYHAASMDDIVKESGLSKGALYGYFDSKEELFLGLRARLVEFDLERVIAAMPASAPATEKLMKVGELALRSQARLDRDMLRVSFEFWTSAPRMKPLQGYYHDLYHENHQFLVALIREGMTRGEFRRDLDPEALSWILIAVVDGLGMHSASLPTGVDFDWEAVERAFLSMVRDGILVRPRRSRHA